MTDLERLKNTFDEIGIGYTVTNIDIPYNYINLFLHYSNVDFEFDINGKYSHIEISI